MKSIIKFSKDRKEKLYIFLLLLPGIGYIFLLFALPLFTMIARSFGLFAIGHESKFTFEFYKKFFSDPLYSKSLLFTLYIGFASALGSLITAIPLSIFMRRNFIGKSTLSVLMKVPIVIPSLIATFMIMSFISPQGLINTLIMHLGIIKEPLILVQDDMGIGILIIQMWKNIPFMTIIISAVMMGINDSVIEAAQNLGASKLQTIIYVILPLSMPGISTAFLITFIKAFGGFQIPALIGPVFKPTIPVLMQQEAMTNFNWSTSSMLGTIVTIVAFIVMYLYVKLLNNDQKKGIN